MNYLVLGLVSSEQELRQVVANVRVAPGARRRIEQLVEFMNIVSDTEEFGLSHEMHRWRHFDATVKLFCGRPKRDAAIWAAVAVAADQRTVALLKIVDTFRDEDLEHSGLLAEALDRLARGRLVEGRTL